MQFRVLTGAISPLSAAQHGRREPRKCRDLAGRQAIDLRKVISNLANLGQTDKRAADLAAALDVWAIAQAVESTLAIALGHNDKAVQALALRGRGGGLARETSVVAGLAVGEKANRHRSDLLRRGLEGAFAEQLDCA